MAQTQLRTEQIVPSGYPHYIQEPYDGGFNSMTIALLHFNSNFTDETGNVWTARSGCPTGTAGIDNNIYKWGSGSAHLKENPPDQGDYFDTPFSSKFNIGSNDFSLEFWINLVGVNTGIGLIVGVNDYSVPFYHSEAGRRGWSLFSDTDGIKFAMNDYIFNSGIVLNTDPAWSSWHHLAFCRQGNLFSSYYDGNRTATGTSSSVVLDASGTVMSFSEASGGTFYQEISGHYDEFRFVIGSCSYSGTSFALSENVTDEFFSETAIIGVTTETTNTDGRIPQWTTTGTQLNNGLALVASVGITGSNASIPSEKAVRDAVASGTVTADAYALGLFNSIPTGSFLNLNDTPDSYVGYANYYVQVNPTATGLSFGSGSSGAGSGIQGAGTFVNGNLVIWSGTTGLLVADGGSPPLVFISEITPTGTTASFTSISEIYSTLVIDFVARGTSAAAAVNASLRFNNDTTDANYRRFQLLGYGANSTFLEGYDDSWVINISDSSSPTNSPGSGKITIPFYSKTTFNKTAQAVSSHRRSATSVGILSVGLEWENTAAITRVDIILASGNFVSGSTFRLYGIR